MRADVHACTSSMLQNRDVIAHKTTASVLRAANEKDTMRTAAGYTLNICRTCMGGRGDAGVHAQTKLATLDRR